MNATEMIDHLNSRLDALKIENDRLKARPHTTHHDDCGCKSARYEATIADLLEALEAILSAVDGDGWTIDELRACVGSHARSAIAKANEQTK